MQKIVAGLMILSVTLFGGNLLYKLAGEGQSLSALNEAFVASEAALVEMNMNGWAKVASSALNEEQLKALIRVGSQASFGVLPAKIVVSSEGGVVMAQASFAAAEYQIDISAQALSDETYLNMTLLTNNTSRTLEDAQQRIKKFFAASNLKPELTSCLIGVVKGRLSSQQTAAIISKILAVLQAEMQESYSDGAVMNVLGYSKRLPGGLTISGRKQNIALTARYNPNDGSTYLWIAWPTFSLPI